MTQTTILVVEDEPNIVESLRFILSQAGFAVEVATDGADALRRIRTQSFAAIILDVMLPGMNGLDILRDVRTDEKLGKLPVIVLTAKGQSHDRKNAEEIGASAFITKPFSNAEVVERVLALAKAG